MTRMTFEKAMSQLEQIVQDLETGDMPLEKALKKFEEGVKLSRYCEQQLDETEARITLLTRGSGEETDVRPDDLNSPQGET
ncbi:MAG: exodeoxyribonuclease VII small subunit [Desulfobacterales bacterium]|nr:exodeoxyribonuclease VII small subunit [Desulfobacterales bacterium]